MPEQPHLTTGGPPRPNTSDRVVTDLQPTSLVSTPRTTKASLTTAADTADTVKSFAGTHLR